jgi:hypothetical protein
MMARKDMSAERGSEYSVAMWAHANANYAEVWKRMIPEMLDSYDRFYSLLAEHKFPATLEINGMTLELLEEKRPDTLKKLQQLVWSKTVELNGSTYSHPFMPVLSEERARLQLEKYLQIHKRLFGEEFRPQGIYLPEYIYQNNLYWVLRDLGYEYVYVWGDRLAQGQRRNLNFAVNRVPDLVIREVREENVSDSQAYDRIGEQQISGLDDTNWKATLAPCKLIGDYRGSADQELIGVPIHGAILDFVRRRTKGEKWEDADQLMEILQERWGEGRRGLFIPALSDQEFFKVINGIVGSDTVRPAWTEDQLVSYMQHLRNKYGDRLMTVSEHLRQFPPPVGCAIYMPSGGDADVRVWMDEPDNRLLNDGGRRIAERLDFIRAIAEMMKNRPEGQLLNNQTEAMEKKLMRLEGSDYRGFVPTPEKKVEAFELLHQTSLEADSLWKKVVQIAVATGALGLASGKEEN